MITEDRIDHIQWARQLNGRWIVHNKLNDTAAAWMEHSAEDPKPWFYGALFSLATPSEAGKFLAGHPLLASVVPALQSCGSPPTLESVDNSTRRKILRLRDVLHRLTMEA